MKAKLTKRVVESEGPTARDQFIWDSQLAGFGCKITPNGKRVYVVQKRIGRRMKRITIGQHGPITTEQARRKAQKLLASISAGEDPAAARQQARNAPTVNELSDRYLQEHAIPYKRSRSVEEDRRNLRLHVLPRIGKFHVGDITEADIGRIHQQMSHTPVAANRVRALLSKMFSLAERWQLRPRGSNPCSAIEKYREEGHERFLSELELARLGRVLDQAEQQQTERPEVTTAIRLLLLTGARLSEILTLRWEYIDLDAGTIRLPDSKTGAKVIPLNGAAAAVLRQCRHMPSGWVLPGRQHRSHIVNLQKPWQRIRKQARLEDVRIHDLRHTFASTGIGVGLSLAVIGKTLGHRSNATTGRYAHLADKSVAAASEVTASHIATHLGTQA